jgi:4-amino-4-deoxy-L-arabinose transferase-like glycosyltransferase
VPPLPIDPGRWNRIVAVLSIAALIMVGVLLYVTRLGEVPIYLMHDEAQGALQAQAIATTGRDLNGRLLPLYFTEPEFPPGRDPAMIYVTALGLKVLPFSEAGVRTPTALVGILNVVLTFVVARRLFSSVVMGLVAATLLLLTPVHFIRARLLLSPLYTIPFILVWLWTLARFAAEPTTRRLCAAAVALGLGAYSYLAAVVMMPLYLLGTLFVGVRRLGRTPALQAALVFGATLIPMLLWYVTHPERNAQIVSAYQLEATARSPLARWVGLYWSFFDPSFLFVSGDASMINSTREAGFFPMAFAVLLPIGLIGLIRTRQPLPLAIVAGLLTAPVVSIISGGVEMNRIMFAIPFGVLTAAYGAHMLIAARPLLARATGVLLLITVPWQFAGFYSGYVNGYRLASARWFAGSAREAARATMTQAEGTAGPVYISTGIDWIHRTWRFYAIADRRPEMIDRAKYVTESPVDAASGALFLCISESPGCTASASWDLAETITSIDGVRSFRILRRVAGVVAVR